MMENVHFLATEKHSVGEVNIDVRKVYERLILADVGEVLSYKELSGLIDRDVQREGYSVVKTARNQALKNKSIVFDCVLNEGLKRLSDGEVVGLADGVVGRIRRSCYRAVRVQASTDSSKLSNEELIKKHQTISGLGGIGALMKPPKWKMLVEKVRDAESSLSLAETLAAFQKK